MTSRSDPSQRWQPHPVGAALLHTFAALIPLVGGFLGASIVAGSIDQPATNPGRWLWWLGLAGVAVAVAWLVGRLSAGLVPLADLMDLDLTFPGVAPDRASIINRASDLVELRRTTTKTSTTGGQDPGGSAASALAVMTALDRHDPRHRGHSKRTAQIADLLAQEIGLTPTDREKLRWASLLHDVGKIGLPDDVLRGSNDDDQVFRGHASRSARMTAPIGGWLGYWVETIEHHHEAWNGTGYPNGLIGEAIPLGARIVAVADTLDRLSNDPDTPLSVAQARRAITTHAGGRFDPAVVRALVRVPMWRLQRIRGPLAGWLPARVGMVFSQRASLIGLAAVFSLTFVASASGSLLPVPDLGSLDLGGLISQPVATTADTAASTPSAQTTAAGGSTTTVSTLGSTLTTRGPGGTTPPTTATTGPTSTSSTAPTATTATGTTTTTTTTRPPTTTTTAAPTTTAGPTTTTAAPTTTTAGPTTTTAAPTTTIPPPTTTIP